MMPPISRSLLLHDVELNEVKRDSYGAESDVLIAHLYYVRLQPSSEVIVTADNANVQCTARMFVDSVNTMPVGVDIAVGNSVIWNGKRYKVQKVAPYYDDRRLHHTEVELSDG